MPRAGDASPQEDQEALTPGDTTITSTDKELKLRVWENRTAPIIIAAAILPLARIGADPKSFGPTFWVDLGCWGVFVIDLIVHLRLANRYWRTVNGIFDIAIVALTFPWYIVPFFDHTTFITIIRLARVVRILWVALGRRGVRRLAQRLGKTAIYVVALLFICSAIVQQNEPASAGFADYWDSLWWGIVTITTVGYGDLVPVTSEGRIAASILMVAGVALLGVLAGTLSSFLNLDNDARKRHAESKELRQRHQIQDEVYTEERSDLKAEIHHLRDRLDSLHDKIDELTDKN